jgi:hypothetical protein
MIEMTVIVIAIVTAASALLHHSISASIPEHERVQGVLRGEH